MSDKIRHAINSGIHDFLEGIRERLSKVDVSEFKDLRCILMMKSISPQMDPGVQAELAARCRKWLERTEPTP